MDTDTSLFTTIVVGGTFVFIWIIGLITVINWIITHVRIIIC